MKPLSLLFLLLSVFVAKAQRIDYALNNQSGLSIVSPIQLRVISDNIFVVSYKAIDATKRIHFYTSAIASDGSLLSTNKLLEAGPTDNLSFDLTQTGFNLWYTSAMAFGSGPFYYTYNVTGATYDSDFGDGNVFYDYHKDSVTSFQMLTNAERFAIIDNNPQNQNYLRVGNISFGKDVEALNEISFDSIPIWGYSLTWLNNKSLFINKSSSAVIYHFGDSNNIINQEQAIKCDRPVLFRNQLFDLKNNFTFDDTLTSMFLINKSGSTIWSFDCKQAQQPYGRLISTPQNLISIHQKSEMIQLTKYDSLIINYFDSTLSLTNRIALPLNFFVRSIEVDSVSGQLVIYGRTSDELVLMLVRKDGVVNSVNEINQSHKITAYPNPVSQTLYLNLPSQTRKINIYTSLGTLVLTTNSVNQLDVSALTNGLYLIEVLDNNNQRIATTRILKQ
jgi:hypothetical protein